MKNEFSFKTLFKGFLNAFNVHTEKITNNIQENLSRNMIY